MPMKLLRDSQVTAGPTPQFGLVVDVHKDNLIANFMYKSDFSLDKNMESIYL